jgi:hypothetical protein
MRNTSVSERIFVCAVTAPEVSTPEEPELYFHAYYYIPLTQGAAMSSRF